MFVAGALLFVWRLFTLIIWWPGKRLLRRIRKFLGRHEFWYWTVTWVGCGLLGTAIVMVSPVKVAAGILGTLILVICMRRLEFGVVGLMILGASFMHPTALPQPITLGGQGLHAIELLLLGMLAVVFVRAFGQRRLEFFKSPITLPLILFGAAIIMSMFVSYIQYRANRIGYWSFRAAYNDARPMFVYLVFFVVAFGIRTEKQLRIILVSLIIISVVISLMMIAQSFIGAGGTKLFIGNEWNRNIVREADVGDVEVARTEPPGLGPITVLFPIALACAASLGFRKGAVYLSAAAVMGIGLMSSFYRVFWVASLTEVAIVWLLAGNKVKIRLPAYGILALILALSGMLAASRVVPLAGAEKFPHALAERALSIFSEETYTTSGSYQGRVQENRTAIAQIKDSPILGIGSGTPKAYRQWTRPGVWTRIIYPVYKIHNSYLGLWTMYGLLGIVSFVWVSVAVLLRSFLLFRRLRDPMWQSVALGFFAAYIGFLWRCITQMHATNNIHHILSVVVMWGFMEVLWRLHEEGVLSGEERRETLTAVVASGYPVEAK